MTGRLALTVIPSGPTFLKPGGRLVANAVTLEGEAALLAVQARLGGDLIRLSLAQAKPLGGFHGWRPAMPVTLYSVTKRSANESGAPPS